MVATKWQQMTSEYTEGKLNRDQIVKISRLSGCETFV